MTSRDNKVSSFGRRIARRLQRIRFNPLFRKHITELRRLRGTNASNRCFIIGNGPSLNKMDLSPLKSEITFGTNAIFLNYDRMGFEPTYYAVSDSLLAEDRNSEINRLSGSTKFFPQDLVYCLKPAPNVCYVPFRYTVNEPVPFFSRDASEVVCLDASVTFMCLQLAFHMGFHTVYLLGMDHTYTSPHHKQQETVVSSGADPDHFHPAYCPREHRINPYRAKRVDQVFQLARTEFETAGRRVINATAGGHLEVFERKDYAGLLEV